MDGVSLLVTGLAKSSLGFVRGSTLTETALPSQVP